MKYKVSIDFKAPIDTYGHKFEFYESKNKPVIANECFVIYIGDTSATTKEFQEVIIPLCNVLRINITHIRDD